LFQVVQASLRHLGSEFGSDRMPVGMGKRAERDDGCLT
jgi:hypothetical protein